MDPNICFVDDDFSKKEVLDNVKLFFASITRHDSLRQRVPDYDVDKEVERPDTEPDSSNSLESLHQFIQYIQREPKNSYWNYLEKLTYLLKKLIFKDIANTFQVQILINNRYEELSNTGIKENNSEVMYCSLDNFPVVSIVLPLSYIDSVCKTRNSIVRQLCLAAVWIIDNDFFDEDGGDGMRRHARKLNAWIPSIPVPKDLGNTFRQISKDHENTSSLTNKLFFLYSLNSQIKPKYMHPQARYYWESRNFTNERDHFTSYCIRIYEDILGIEKSLKDNLSILWDPMKHSDGHLSIISKPGSKSTLRLSLPRIQSFDVLRDVLFHYLTHLAIRQLEQKRVTEANYEWYEYATMIDSKTIILPSLFEYSCNIRCYADSDTIANRSHFLLSMSSEYPESFKADEVSNLEKSDDRTSLLKEVFSIFNSTFPGTEDTKKISFIFTKNLVHANGLTIFDNSNKEAPTTILISSARTTKLEDLRDTILHQLTLVKEAKESEEYNTHGYLWRYTNEELKKELPLAPTISKRPNDFCCPSLQEEKNIILKWKTSKRKPYGKELTNHHNDKLSIAVLKTIMEEVFKDDMPSDYHLVKLVHYPNMAVCEDRILSTIHRNQLKTLMYVILKVVVTIPNREHIDDLLQPFPTLVKAKITKLNDMQHGLNRMYAPQLIF